LHIRPAFKEDKEPAAVQVQTERSSFKKEKRIDLMKNLKDETSWNALFLNPNTVMEHITAKFQISKVVRIYKRPSCSVRSTATRP